MRTNNQIEIIIFKKEGNNLLFLILKRSPENGEFWQPITGGVEENEKFKEAAIREVQEEVGITNKYELIDIDYSFEFNENDVNHVEKVFGLKISPNEKIILSEEHTEFKWVTGQVALAQFLKYPGNKEGFKRIMNLYESSNYKTTI